MPASSALRSARLLALLDFAPGAIAESIAGAHPGTDARALAARAVAERRAFVTAVADADADAHRAAVEAEHDLGASMHGVSACSVR